MDGDVEGLAAQRSIAFIAFGAKGEAPKFDLVLRLSIVQGHRNSSELRHVGRNPSRLIFREQLGR